MSSADLAIRDAWLRIPQPVAGPRARLACFPHAGGAASTFHPWSRRLPADVELLAVQYPGRQDRVDEPCARRMAELVEPLTAALFDGGAPLALFGHSMGAAVAHEVARALERAGQDVAHMFVSGRPAPGLRREETDASDDDALLDDVERLSGTRIDDPALKELVLPALRADYELIGAYAPVEGAPLDAPITACIGDEDPEVTPEEANAWAQQTRGPFRLWTFAGTHFYLTENEPALLESITATLEPVGHGSWPSTP